MTPVLVDTSVWRRYLTGRTTARDTRALGSLLGEDGAVLIHRAVVGELVLGGLSSREEELLRRLPSADEVSSDELLPFIRSRHLARRGIGWVDAHLLAATLLTSAVLWSLDGKLAAVAEELGVSFATART